MFSSLGQNFADAVAPGSNPNSGQAPTGFQSRSRDDSSQTTPQLHDEELAAPRSYRHVDNQGESELDRALRRAQSEAQMAGQQIAELRMARSNLSGDQVPPGSQSPSEDDSYQMTLQLFKEELAAPRSSHHVNDQSDHDMALDSQLWEVQSAEQRARQEEADHRMAASITRAMDFDAVLLAEAAPSDYGTVDSNAELLGEVPLSDDATLPSTSSSTAVDGIQRRQYAMTHSQVVRAIQGNPNATSTTQRETLQMGSLLPPDPGRHLNDQTSRPAVRSAPAFESVAGRATTTDTAARETDNNKKRSANTFDGISTPPPAKRPAHSVECTGCGDERPRGDTVSTSCGHNYCRRCIRCLFNHAIRNETSWPPQCCEPIPLVSAQHFLRPEVVSRFHARQQEWDTPPDKRIYCSDPNCAAFIPTPAAGTVALCTQCHDTTCVNCKKPYHEGECNNHADQDLEQLRSMALENGWQECQSCHNFVEQNRGCFHMTCRCKHQFCYLCNTEWKNCTCRRWDEGLLLDQEVVRGVAAVQEDLCNHNWTREGWPDVCDLCGDRMNRYIMECPDCRTRYCLWCTQGIGLFRHRHRRRR